MAYTPALADPSKAPPPEQIVLKSSFLATAVYDAGNRAITLSFKNGFSTIHQEVYPSTWSEFKLSPSHGSFYAKVLKKQFPAVPVHTMLKVSDLEKARKDFNPKVA